MMHSSEFPGFVPRVGGLRVPGCFIFKGPYSLTLPFPWQTELRCNRQHSNRTPIWRTRLFGISACLPHKNSNLMD